ncbi:MAG: hypothetical protein PVS2B2_05820 [Candidatus Acidiferrum sp.]
MSTEMHGHDGEQSPRHKDVSFEGSDVETKIIYRYLMFLAISVLATFAVCIYIERAAITFSRESETQMAPSRAAMGSNYNALPPEPRLQGVPGHSNDPQRDLREMRQDAKNANESYQWIDKNAGIAQIPVSEAMKMIAEKGVAGATEAAREPKKMEPKEAERKK